MNENIVGLDWGERRVGVAVSVAGIVLTKDPLSTEDSIALAAEQIRRYGATRAFVGLPLTLRGVEGRSSIKALEFASALSTAAGVPVYLVDERFSSVVADQLLRDAGRSGRERRRLVDSESAAELLRFVLSAEETNPNISWRQAGV